MNHTNMSNHIQHITEAFEDSEIAGYTTPGWYFWDETEAYCHGPYSSMEKAEQQFDLYCKTQLR